METTYDFPKWEGTSFEYQTKWGTDEVFPTEVYDGKMSVEEFISQNFRGERVIQHHYRWLVMKLIDGECQEYDSGETQTSCFDVDENGVITEVLDYDYWDFSNGCKE